MSRLQSVLLALVALLAAALPASAGQAEPSELGADFAAGVSAYRSGDLTSAHALWSGLLDRQLTPEDRGLLLFDLGNLAFREQRYLDAVARYTGALETRPRDAALWHNLELARSRAGLDPADRGDLSATLRRVALAPTGAELEWLLWAAVLLLVIALGFELRRGGPTWKLLAAGALVVVVGDLAWIGMREARGLERPAMVVVDQGSFLRSEPNPELASIALLEAGRLVELGDRLGGWVAVRAGADVGWIEEAEVLSLFERRP